MRILVISDVPWKDDNSVGNTYNNIFKNMKDAEFANLYCRSGYPNTKIVNKYFQITEKKMLKNLLGKSEKEDIHQNFHIDVLNNREQMIFDKVRTLRFQSFFLIRELIWKIGKWKTHELNDFLNSFQPDIIFSFCLGSIYYLNLIDYCSKYTNSKLVIFFADDVYSYLNKNPLHLIYKYYVRKKISNITSICNLTYGASPQLCNEYSTIFHKKINPLFKICENSSQDKHCTNKPLKITYTGNLFYGRWKILALIAQTIKEINFNFIKIELNIYTAGLITKEMKEALNIEGYSQLVGAIPYEQVKKVLQSSDLVLHVESFDDKEIRKTRLSFSTKIVDCMESGSCLLAVGPEKTASIKILKDNNIALVVSNKDKNKIRECLLRILENNNSITDTAQRMNQYAAEKHSLDTLTKKLYIPLENLCKDKEDFI